MGGAGRQRMPQGEGTRGPCAVLPSPGRVPRSQPPRGTRHAIPYPLLQSLLLQNCSASIIASAHHARHRRRHYQHRLFSPSATRPAAPRVGFSPPPHATASSTTPSSTPSSSRCMTTSTRFARRSTMSFASACSSAITAFLQTPSPRPHCRKRS